MAEQRAVGEPLRALVVDDEAPARAELAFLLRADERIGSVEVAATAQEALRLLALQDGPGAPTRPGGSGGPSGTPRAGAIDVVFCDIKMPGLDGVELARVTARFVRRPQLVFVTAYDDRAVEAFDLQAVDYVMKPVRAERLAEAVRRVLRASGAAPAGGEPAELGDDETIAVELAGVTRFVRRSQVRYVEAQGDYARLHTADGSHLLRTPLSVLEQRWSQAGFVRVHRSILVALRHIDEVRVVDGHTTVLLGRDELPVSRRHNRGLRERLGRP